jgi:hypothetical protein
VTASTAQTSRSRQVGDLTEASNHSLSELTAGSAQGYGPRRGNTGGLTLLAVGGVAGEVVGVRVGRHDRGRRAGGHHDGLRPAGRLPSFESVADVAGLAMRRAA